jgi:hypothetical protein
MTYIVVATHHKLIENKKITQLLKKNPKKLPILGSQLSSPSHQFKITLHQCVLLHEHHPQNISNMYLTMTLQT